MTSLRRIVDLLLATSCRIVAKYVAGAGLLQAPLRAQRTIVNAAIIVVHKPKLVDELVEPRMLAKGLQAAWYGSGAAKNMAHALYELGPRALGEMYAELASSFAAMVRDYNPDAAAAFVHTLERGKIVCRDDQVHDLLSVMIDEMDAAFATRTEALDPALASLFWQGGYWPSRLETRFELLHDDSTSVRRWQEGILSDMQRRLADMTAPEARSPFTSRRYSTPSSSRCPMMMRGCRSRTCWRVRELTCMR